jgi:hypothetical protein
MCQGIQAKNENNFETHHKRESKVMHKYQGTNVEKLHIWMKEMLLLLSESMIKVQLKHQAKTMEVCTEEEIDIEHPIETKVIIGRAREILKVANLDKYLTFEIIWSENEYLELRNIHNTFKHISWYIISTQIQNF